MNFFPKVRPASNVDADTRASAIDYVNRVNWLFETWDLEAMIGAFLPVRKSFISMARLMAKPTFAHS